jgi:hypothetical protein
MDVRFSDCSSARIAGEKNLNEQIEDLHNLVSHGQIGNVDEIYAHIALVRLSNSVNEILDSFVGQASFVHI